MRVWSEIEGGEMNIARMKASEATEQIKLFEWAKKNEEFIPELKLIYHVPNEGKRKVQTGKIMKAEGMKSGVPDICLPVSRDGYGSLYIEMKFGKNKPTEEQNIFMNDLRSAGNKAEVCYSAIAAREVIRHYLRRSEGFDLVNCETAAKISGRCEGYLRFSGTPCNRCIFYSADAGKGIKQC